MIEDISAFFEANNAEYIKFNNVEKKLHTRPDICAFLLLDKLDPSERDIVSAAEHDEIYLDVNIENIKKNATEIDLLTLIRCGVRYDEYLECFSMFV